ncbi:MAG: hypothetical protein PVG79_13565, partial [Gemmatimonadales bacterium]
PSALFSVIAFYRQMFEDAAQQGAHLQAFNRDPSSVAPPAWDADMEVVRQIMGGELPVFFEVDLGRDIHRVLQLAREYDFRPIIVGGEEAWKVADELTAADVPVLVSLDFPEPERWEPGDDNGDEEEELDAATLREKQRIEDAYANAGRLAEAGVSFALTSGGGRAEILEGARKAIEYGLSEQDALRAVTATPTSLLGIEHMALLRAHGPATFIVTDAPIFDEEMKVRYVFVEGELEKGREVRVAGEEPAVDMTGTWDVTITAEGQSIPATMTVTQEGASFEGTMMTPFGEAEVQDGLVSGNDVSFTIALSAGGETMTIEATGTVEGDRGSGSGESPDGSFTWTARRSSGPGEEN